MIKLNRWLDKPEHRILIFLSLWVVLSWFIAVPEIQLGRYLIRINATSDLVNLSFIVDSTFVTRFVAQWLDKVPILTNIIYSFAWYELVFFAVLILFCAKDQNFIYLSYSAKTVLIIQLSMHVYLFVQLYRLNSILNPNTAINIIYQISYIYQILGFLTLLISFLTFMVYIFKLGANSLHA